ncbi:hypothetical protein FWF48_01290, partial [Candidatus Saccharibacteria bacterium]|nr:hypothetical protein [Candidatus Saccharibacteria bacterium]
MRLPKKLQLLQISLPAIIALAVFAVVRLAPLAHAAPSDFIDIPNTQTGTITITLNNGSDNTGGDCYFFDISGLTGTAASYNGAGYWLGDGYPGWGINLLAGTGNYNIVVDGAGCTSYSDGALNIYMQGVTLTQLGAYSPLQLQNGAGVDLTVNGVNTFSSSTSAGIGVDSGNSIMITSGNGGVLNASSGRDSGIGGSGVSQFGNITIGGNVQVNASGMSGGIGGGGQDSYNFAGTITITDNARVSAIVLPGNPSAGYNSFGAGIGTGECAFCDSAYPGAGNTGKVVISGNAFVYADGSNSIQGYDIGAGYGFTLNEVDITGGTVIADSISGGLVNISGGFVYSSNILATNYQSDGANEGQNPILNKVSITSGSVFILNMSNASVIPSPTDASDSLVYPLYIPTTLSPNNANTANSNVDFSTATPSVPYTLHTLTP